MNLAGSRGAKQGVRSSGRATAAEVTYQPLPLLSTLRGQLAPRVIITGGLVSRHPVVLQAWSVGEGGVAAPAASETQAELAYRQVKMAILEGGLPPGFQASEQQLALKLNMSRTPMHQAIVRLEAEEWLELSPRRGVLIASIDAAEMREVYETLMALEGAAVSKLAKRPIDASDPTEAALQASCRACVTALEAEDLRAWAEADHAFHTLLVDVSGNRRLARLARSVSEQAHRARLLTVRLRPRPDASNADHQAILDAIVNREPSAARAALELHRQRGIDTLVPILEALAPPASPLSAP